MKNNSVFVVTSFSSYENGEIFYGLESLFATKEAAEQHIRVLMDEELEVCDSNDVSVDYAAFKIEDAGHFFHWKLQECELPTETAGNDKNIGVNNSGNWNSGNSNSGNWNSGDNNSGNGNSGNDNSGNNNSGDNNSGDCNSGNCNSGHCNSGHCNSGHGNSGHGNNGNFNSGDGSSGEWNSASFSFGCFNTPNMSTQKIFLFDKPSDWTMGDWFFSAARKVMFYLGGSPVRWIPLKEMSEEEKKEHPEYATTQGYLKTLSEEEQISQRIEKWKALSDEEKRIIFSIPNFDKEIFKQITGIDVDN